MKIRRWLESALVMAIVLLVVSCFAPNVDKMNALSAQWKQDNERLANSLGERMFEKDRGLVFSAILVACANSGLPVKNTDRESGYVLAEGPLPLPADEAMRFAKQCAEDLTRAAGGSWQALPNNAFYSVTVTVAKIAPAKTRVRLRIAARTTQQAANISNDIYPPIAEELYKMLWSRIEKEIFLQENLDKAKP